jgi:hypothetical protein
MRLPDEVEEVRLPSGFCTLPPPPSHASLAYTLPHKSNFTFGLCVFAQERVDVAKVQVLISSEAGTNKEPFMPCTQVCKSTEDLQGCPHTDFSGGTRYWSMESLSIKRSGCEVLKASFLQSRFGVEFQ